MGLSSPCHARFRFIAVFLSRKPAVSLKWGKIDQRLLSMTRPNGNLGSCIRAYDWYQNSMTLDDPKRRKRPFRTLLQNPCVFRVYHLNVNEDGPTLSAAKMWHSDCSLWQYNVCADIREGSLETRRQTTVGKSKTSIFRAFGRYVFGCLGNEEIIT